MAWSDNEGNVVKQLGRSLNMIRINVEQEDVRGIANHIRNMISDCAPYIADMQKYAMPRDDDNEEEVFERLMQIKGELLCEMSEKGIYAWKEQEPGDASGLALRDGE